jgi:hypothetical protein
MPQYPVPAAHSIVVGTPSGIMYMEFLQGTGTAILPGDVVEFTTPGADCTVKAAAADTDYVIGVADIHYANLTTGGGKDRTHAYAAGDPVLIFRGSVICMLRLLEGQTGIGCGEFLQPAGSGEVTLYVCGTDHDCQRVAQALETIANDTDNFQWVMCALERFG